MARDGTADRLQVEGSDLEARAGHFQIVERSTGGIHIQIEVVPLKPYKA